MFGIERNLAQILERRVEPEQGYIDFAEITEKQHNGAEANQSTSDRPDIYGKADTGHNVPCTQ